MHPSTPRPPRPSETPAPVTLPARARILVVRAAGIGDLLLAVPALRALRDAYPAARIDVLAGAQAAPLLADSPLVDRVLGVEKAAYDDPRALLRAPWRLAPLAGLARCLRAGRYDAILLMHHLTLPFGRLKYRLLLATARPVLSAGLDNGHGAFLDRRIPDAGFGARHEARYCLDLAAAAGAAVPTELFGPSLADLGWGPVPAAPSPPEPGADGRVHSAPTDGRMRSAPMDEGRAAMSPQPGGALSEQRRGRCTPPPAVGGHDDDGFAAPLVALHAGSGGYSPARRWPAARFAALARALHDERGARVVLVGGAEDAGPAQACRAALGARPWLEDAVGTLDLRETAALLARCDLFVGNDSLPAHLAAAAGTPVVAIFGPSNATAWRPLPRARDAFVAVVRRDLPCSPCFYRGHALGTPAGCPPRPCLTELGVAPVLAQARRALRREAASTSPRG